MISYLLQGISVLGGERFCVVILFWPVLFHLEQTHAQHILHTHTHRCKQAHQNVHSGTAGLATSDSARLLIGNNERTCAEQS